MKYKKICLICNYGMLLKNNLLLIKPDKFPNQIVKDILSQLTLQVNFGIFGILSNIFPP